MMPFMVVVLVVVGVANPIVLRSIAKSPIVVSLKVFVVIIIFGMDWIG